MGEASLRLIAHRNVAQPHDLGFEVLDFADGAAEQHGDDHAEQLNYANADANDEYVREVLFEHGLELGRASLKKQNPVITVKSE